MGAIADFGLLRLGRGLAILTAALLVAWASFGVSPYRQRAERSVSAVPDQPILVQSGSPQSALNIRALVLGAEPVAAMTIANAGGRSTYVRLRAVVRDPRGSAGAALSEALEVHVFEGDRPVYMGTLAGLTSGIPVGELMAGGTRRFRFETRLPREAADSLPDARINAYFAWTTAE
jgi:hypothetical protein